MLDHILCLVIALACRVREHFTAAQHIFVGGKALGRLPEGAVELEAGELDRRRADNAPRDVFLHAEDVLDLGVVDLRPPIPPQSLPRSARR